MGQEYALCPLNNLAAEEGLSEEEGRRARQSGYNRDLQEKSRVEVEGPGGVWPQGPFPGRPAAPALCSPGLPPASLASSSSPLLLPRPVPRAQPRILPSSLF